MVVDNKKLETLEQELKLMKGELKQSLASVRDYLLNMELPSSEFATVLAALGGGGGDQNVSMKGSFTTGKDTGLDEPAQEEPSFEEPQESIIEEESIEPESELSQEDRLNDQDEPLTPESELPPEEEMADHDENFEPASELPSEEEESGEQDESFVPESELPAEEEPQMEHGMINAEASQSTPKVNLLANLITWVSRAKKEIGNEQLPTFLEVYGISGHMSPELKEVILHLADIAAEQPEDAETAEIWSQSMLALHGILTGGEAPLYPVTPFWNESDSETPPSEDEVTEAKAEKPEDMPLKLKLVFPSGDGKSQEFCINLTPEVNNNGS